MSQKRKKKKKLIEPVQNNPVAKFAFRFNKSKRFKDKTKYKRRMKYQDELLV